MAARVAHVIAVRVKEQFMLRIEQAAFRRQAVGTLSWGWDGRLERGPVAESTILYTHPSSCYIFR